MKNVWIIAGLEAKTVWRLPMTPAVVGAAMASIFLAATLSDNTTMHTVAGEWTAWGRLLGPWWHVALGIVAVYFGTVRVASLKSDARWDTLLSLPIRRGKIVAGMFLGRVIAAAIVVIPLMAVVGVIHADPSIPGQTGAITTATQIGANVGVGLLVVAYLTSGSFLNAILFPRLSVAFALSMLPAGMWLFFAWVFPYTFVEAVDEWLFALQLGLNPYWLARTTALGVIPIATIIGVTVGVAAHATMAVIADRHINFVYDPQRGKRRFVYRWRPLLGTLAVGFSTIIGTMVLLGTQIGLAAFDMTAAKITRPGPRASDMAAFEARTDPISRFEGPLVATYFYRTAKLMPAVARSTWRPIGFRTGWEGAMLAGLPNRPPVGVDFYGHEGWPMRHDDVIAWQSAVTHDTESAPPAAGAQIVSAPGGMPADALALFESLAISRADAVTAHGARQPRDRVILVGSETRLAWKALLEADGYEVVVAFGPQIPLDMDRRLRDIVLVTPQRWELSADECDLIARFRLSGGAVFVALPRLPSRDGVPQTLPAADLAAAAGSESDTTNGETETELTLVGVGGLALPAGAELAKLMARWGLVVAPAQWYCDPYLLPTRGMTDAVGNRQWFVAVTRETLQETGHESAVTAAVAVRDFAMQPTAPALDETGAAIPRTPWAPMVWMPEGQRVDLRVPGRSESLDGTMPVAAWLQRSGTEGGPAVVSAIEPFVEWAGGTRILGNDERDLTLNLIARLANRPDAATNFRRKPLVPNLPPAGHDGSYPLPYLAFAIVAGLVALIATYRRFRLIHGAY